MSKPRARGDNATSDALRRCTLPQVTSSLQGVQQQILLTLAGSAIVVLVLVACALIYTALFRQSFAAIQEAARLYRDGLAEEVLEEVAATLVPLHRSVTRLAQRARQGSDEWLPPREFFLHPTRVHINRLAAWLHAELAEETRIRSVHTNGNGAAPLPIKRLGAAVGLAADLETVASVDDCEHVVRLYLREPTPGRYDVLAQHAEGDGSGGRVMTSSSYGYNPTTARARNPTSAAVAPCEGALRGVEEALASEFGNWSWTYQDLSNSTANGARVVLHGTAPIYSLDGSRTVGRVYGNTNNEAFSRALSWVLDESRNPWTDGGHFILVDREGRILAQTEFRTNSPDDITQLPPDSYLLAAIEEVVAQAGETCPDVRLSMDHANRLIDVEAFRAEDFGMPPMGDLRWCVIMTVPRDNIYGAIDTARLHVDVSAIIILVVSMVSLAFLFLALLSGNQERKRLELDKLRMDQRKVEDSIKEVKELNCPMALISAQDFLALERLDHHEALRDRRKLVILDSLGGEGGILKFQERNLIAFISHQWLGFSFPDVEGAGQLRVMQDAIRHCVENPVGDKSVYVWVDYISIAQCHRKLQWAAVSSLPVYASVADVFIIVAPTLRHADTRLECNLETYMRRGWCRAEMLSKACAGGLKDMYVATGEQERGTLLLLSDLSTYSLNVFEGEFTVRSDQESLVKPVLGLYSLVLEDPTSEHMQQIHSHILEDKEAFFPRTYLNAKGEQVELFGPCIDLLHEAVRKPATEGD